MPLPLHTVKDWAPFRLDALGLVTLLGAEEVNVAIGALEHSLFTECLPLFGTYMIAGNKFTHPIPGFALYNITDGVYVPIVNGWFARWLVANLRDQVTTLVWVSEQEKRSIVAKEILGMLIGFVAHGFLITIATLQGDYYGIANALAMAVSVIVRLRMVHENRSHLNRLVDEYLSLIHKANRTQEEEKKAQSWKSSVNIVITTPEDRLIVFQMPRGLVRCIVIDLDVVRNKKSIVSKKTETDTDTEPAQKSQNKSSSGSDMDPESGLKTRSTQLETAPIEKASLDMAIHNSLGTPNAITSPPGPGDKTIIESSKKVTIVEKDEIKTHSLIYTLTRGVGWVFFAIHVICIGQSSLLNQMLSISLLVTSTLLTIYNVGNDNIVGKRLCIKKGVGLESHKDAYLYLRPTPQEVRILEHYLRLPCRPDNNGDTISQWNSDWWKEWDERYSRLMLSK